MKRNTCARVGMKSIAVELEENITTAELINQIDILNRDKNIHGILLQHPVPSHIDERACFDKISLEKDVDGVTCLGFGNMAMGLNAYGSCTPAGIIRLIESYNLDVEGLNAVVVGRSPILGKPMAMMLLNKNATVTICHSRTKNIESIISEADLIVGAVGIPKFIQKNWIKNDCIVIDAGYHPDKCGDIDLDGVEGIASAFTPVPGGVGPMTINTLILHTLQSAIKTTKV
jgi:methylenetetrahydrofolate dehydrogenase (NADP+)/methenyltetrahydrofolate cyclohydrolase